MIKHSGLKPSEINGISLAASLTANLSEIASEIVVRNDTMYCGEPKRDSSGTKQMYKRRNSTINNDLISVKEKYKKAKLQTMLIYGLWKTYKEYESIEIIAKEYTLYLYGKKFYKYIQL